MMKYATHIIAFLAGIIAGIILLSALSVLVMQQQRSQPKAVVELRE